MQRIGILLTVLVFLFCSTCFAAEAPQNLRIFIGGVDPGPPVVEDPPVADDPPVSEDPPVVENPSPYFDQNFQVARGVSRTSGVAPLSVHFTAGFNASSATDRGFHNYEYAWNFGDPTSGNWGTNGRSKNLAKGPVAAHVYENPGTYTATLAIRDATGVVDTDSFSITVTDPDVVYSGTNTTCISDTANNNFTGCPAGATRVSTDDISRITNYIGSGRRVLLHRGSSWTSSGVNMPSNAGPVTISAYGAGINQDEFGIYSNAPKITLTSGNFIDLSRKQNWRISDLSFIGSGGSGGIFGGAINVQRILIMRLKTTGFGVPIGLSHWKERVSDLIDQITLVSNDISSATEYCVYIGSERLVLLGNKMDDAGLSHVLRVWQAYKGVIQHNFISGSSTQNANGRHALKFHGPQESDTNPNGIGACLDHRTNFAVISDNVFGGSGPWPVTLGPQDAGKDERVSDIIFERNRIHPDYGTQSCCSSPVQVGVLVSARYVTLRNNIIDGTNGSNGFTCISIDQRGIEPPPVRVEVYNNTFYRQDETGLSNSHIGVKVGSSANSTIVVNNFARFPNTNGNAVISNDSNSLVQNNNILSTVSGLVNPNLMNPLLRNYTPLVNSVTDENGSVNVPVLDDFYGNTRTRDNFYDIGAVEN